MPLSCKQRRIYDFIRRYASSNYGQTPTHAEIGQQFQMRSPASVHAHIKVLEQAGMITRIANVSRGIRLRDQAMNPS